MKNVMIIAALVMAIASCTKEKPDHDQIECKRALSIQQKWADSARGLISIDTTVDVRLCEEQLHNFEHATTNVWVKVCNLTTGETLYWEYFINKTLQ
jgi:hypothetical protein